MDTRQFIRRDANHVVIERVGDGGWVEHARFAKIADATNYAIWRNQRHGEIFTAVGFETMVVTESDTATGIVPLDARPEGRPTLDEGLGDGRVAGAWPQYDS